LSSTLSCIGETEKNTSLQSPNLPWIFATSITKPPVEATHYQSGNRWMFPTLITKPPVDIHHFNHQTKSPKPPTFNQATGGSHPLSIRQPVDNTWPGTWFLYLPHQLTPPSSTAKDKSLLIHLFHFNSFHIPSVQNRLLLTVINNSY
jgi:hypothetical protein